MATYENSIHPLGSENSWTIPEEVLKIKVQAPNGRRKPGRPKNQRAKSAAEPKGKTR